MILQSTNPQLALKKATEICRTLGINHTTIQVHEDKEKVFCYTRDCEWEEDLFYGKIDHVGSSGDRKVRSTLCVTTHSAV
jgi:hypothetical protein